MISKIKKRIDQFNKIYLHAFPNSHIEIDQFFRIGIIDYIKTIIGIFRLFTINFSQIEFVFISTRNKEIIYSFDKKKIIIFGANEDIIYCQKLRVKYYWYSGIHSAIKISYNNTSIFLKLYNILLKFKLRNLKYIFLQEDTLPLGIYFTEFCENNNKITICIQHAAHTIVPFLPIDGYNSKYNLLLDNDQKIFYSGTKSHLINLGLTYDVEKIYTKSNIIILVGTGYYGLDPIFYLRSLVVFTLIKNTFSNLGYDVFYRPHPNEILNIDYKSHFKQNEINQTPLKILLSDSRKIFFGYNSSLLYEASKLGHVVINILDKIIPNLIFKTHYTLDINNFETYFINQINESNISDINLIKLKDRVMNAINIINKNEDESIQNKL
jgi:hypothetical protein